LWLVFASQKIVHDVQDEMAEFVVPLRKEIEDSDWARHAKYKGPPQKRTGRKGRKD